MSAWTADLARGARNDLAPARQRLEDLAANLAAVATPEGRHSRLLAEALALEVRRAADAVELAEAAAWDLEALLRRVEEVAP